MMLGNTACGRKDIGTSTGHSTGNVRLPGNHENKTDCAISNSLDFHF